MSDESPTLADYSDYVEYEQRESGGVRGFAWPTDAEVIRCCPWAERFEDPGATLTVAEYAELGRATHERHLMHTFYWQCGRCPFCQAELDGVRPSSQRTGDNVWLSVCGSCGWWRGDGLNETTADGEFIRHRAAILKRFSLASADAPIDLIRTHLGRHPDDSRWLDPKRLEDVVGQVFSDFLDCDVQHVGGPRDGGIDLFLVQGDRTHAVQVKRREKSVPEGVALIREFIGALLLAGEVRGLYVTTAPRFTRPALEAAEIAEQRGFLQRLELVANPRLTEVCMQTSSGEAPWEAAPRLIGDADTKEAESGRIAPVAQSASAWYAMGADPAVAGLTPGLVSDAPPP